MQKVYLVIVHNGIDYADEIKVEAFADKAQAISRFHELCEEDYADLKEGYGEENIAVCTVENETNFFRNPRPLYVIDYNEETYNSYRFGEAATTTYSIYFCEREVK